MATKKVKRGNHWMVKQEPETYSWDDFVLREPIGLGAELSTRNKLRE